MPSRLCVTTLNAVITGKMMISRRIYFRLLNNFFKQKTIMLTKHVFLNTFAASCFVFFNHR